MLRSTMSRHDQPSTEDMAQASPSSSIFQSQKSDEQIAKEFLQAMKEDLADDKEWADELISNVLEMADEYTRRRGGL